MNQLLTTPTLNTVFILFYESIQPVLMHFVGETVAVMHGANAPLMRMMVAEQMERERSVKEGREHRCSIPLSKAVPGNT